MRKWEENVWENVESGVNTEGVGDTIYEGGQMEIDVDEGLRGVRTDSSDIRATSVEGSVNWDKVNGTWRRRLFGRPGRPIALDGRCYRD